MGSHFVVTILTEEAVAGPHDRDQWNTHLTPDFVGVFRLSIIQSRSLGQHGKTSVADRRTKTGFCMIRLTRPACGPCRQSVCTIMRRLGDGVTADVNVGLFAKCWTGACAWLRPGKTPIIPAIQVASKSGRFIEDTKTIKWPISSI